jgi:hypothetical protein
MGVYGDHVLPRIINAACNMKVAREQRARVCEGLSGEIVEIGFGSGLNIPFYPATVTSVDAVEPADLGWKLAAKRLDAATTPIRRSGLDGQSLPFHFVEHGLAPDESVRAWQHRLNPIQKRLFGGCNLNRPTIDLLRGAGFEITQVDEYYEKGSPKAVGAITLGVARSG